MKKLCAILLCLAVVLAMSACASLFEDEYYYSESYADLSGEYEGSDQEIRNYSMLKSAILALVEQGEESASFRFGSYSGSLIDDLAAACVEVKNETPIGAYAVEDISYDTSRIVSYYTAEISISYTRSAEEIARVEHVSGLGEFGSHILNVMDSYASLTVLNVYSSAVNEEYIRQLIHGYYYADPFLTVIEPEVGVAAYPDSGAERIYEISFKYGLSAERLGEMESQLRARVEAMCSDIGGEDGLVMALRCAQSLSGMASGEAQCSYPDTAYGALIEGSVQPLGLALAYKALCDELGIECVVVSGELNDGGVIDHAWNIIGLDGDYYHVDISRFGGNPAASFLLADEDIWGEYFWNQEDYPQCAGPLGPGDVFETAPEQPAEGETAQPPEVTTTPTPEPGAEASPEPGPEPEVSPEPTPTPEPTPPVEEPEPDEEENENN